MQDIEKLTDFTKDMFKLEHRIGVKASGSFVREKIMNAISEILEREVIDYTMEGDSFDCIFITTGFSIRDLMEKIPVDYKTSLGLYAYLVDVPKSSTFSVFKRTNIGPLNVVHNVVHWSRSRGLYRRTIQIK